MNLNIHDYTYDLPPDRIASHPLAQRDASKLLVYNKGKITHTHFTSLVDYLPANTSLFFNNTKVIPARLHFIKDTGADIEIFLLTPISPSVVMIEAMQATHTCTWKCTIGNLKRWPSTTTLTKDVDGLTIHAELLNREEGLVKFTWNTATCFVDIITQSGETPLPPYLKRKAEASDKERYQTVYSQHEGAVAAPTAGLHFTAQILEALQTKGIVKDFVTLHVSAGTFQPVKVENAIEHSMHQEQIVITKNNIENLLRDNKFIVPVGTTSMRTLESLYWYGIKLMDDEDAPFTIDQTYAYRYNRPQPTKKDALHKILTVMNKRNIESIVGTSSIYIHPGYTFKMCDAIVTNFHQPGSTLILLVAAMVGADWRTIYNEALKENYRFLSYGDSSLLIP